MVAKHRWAIGLTVLLVVTIVVVAVRRETAVNRVEGTFLCTLYYTPRETGFSAAGGFDMAMETRPGLEGRMFPRDFLRAVKVEGFGRMARPVQGKPFLFYRGGTWGFSREALDKRGQPLVPKRSAAIASGAKSIPDGAAFRILGPHLPPQLRRQRWVAVDTGGGLANAQIDLYWGEDVPLGPGREIFIPRSGVMQPGRCNVVVLR